MNVRGFTVVEAIVSVAIVMAVTGAVFALLNPAQGMFLAQPEVSEMQQRLRVAVEALSRDLGMAGAGPFFGDAAGPLGRYVPAAAPFRRGALLPDPPGTFASDRLSLLYVPVTPAQAHLAVAMAHPGADIQVAPRSGCPPSETPCGFEVGMTAIVFDETGAHDTFRIAAVLPGLGVVQRDGRPLSKAYGRGASLAEVVEVTYRLHTDAAADVVRLMRYDGDQTDLPIADHVVGLRVEYFGDPRPPALFEPPAPSAASWTTYGPRPPAPDVDDPADLWGPGENCMFVRVEDVAAPRPGLAPFGAATDPLVPLQPAWLVDGPWCPDAASAARFDADLLRVRRVRVTLRVEAGVEALRGSGPLFARPGTSRSGDRYIPDIEVALDVTPGNLGFGR